MTERLSPAEPEAPGQDGTDCVRARVSSVLFFVLFPSFFPSTPVEKAPSTKGLSHPVFEELWNYGYPQEMAHFARCVRGKEKPQATGEDGLVVMKALYAGYASAGKGEKCK